jgi:hypothetical protein
VDKVVGVAVVKGVIELDVVVDVKVDVVVVDAVKVGGGGRPRREKKEPRASKTILQEAKMWAKESWGRPQK